MPKTGRAEMIERRNKVIRDVDAMKGTLICIQIPMEGDHRRWRLYTLIFEERRKRFEIINVSNNVARALGFRYDGQREAVIGGPFVNHAEDIQSAIHGLLVDYESADEAKQARIREYGQNFKLAMEWIHLD